MTTYESVKRYLWPHTLVPFALMIAIDYVNLLGHVLQIGLAAYLAFQLLSGLAGFTAAAFLHFAPSSAWATLFKFQVVRFFPLMQGGRVAFDYLMQEVDDGKQLGEGDAGPDDGQPDLDPLR